MADKKISIISRIEAKQRRTTETQMPSTQSTLAKTTNELYFSDIALKVRALSVKRWKNNRPTEMVGTSDIIQGLQKKLAKVARYSEPVLITGESGVGKELIAQSLYLLGKNLQRPYVSVNCPQYREGNLTASELFGHRKGSFTGAVADRKGAFESANGGVLFLDEVGDLHSSAQPMLLRALASGEFKPLGDDRPRTADVRILAATNRPLNQLLMTQEFRHDLFFRLRYFHLDIPPIRERGTDWKLILDFILSQLEQKYGITKRFSSDSINLLQRYHWPGNIREIITIATMGYAMADGDQISPSDFSLQGEDPSLAPLLSKPVPNPETVTPTSNPFPDLYQELSSKQANFWETVYRPFMQRDLNRAEVRAVIQKGLSANVGSYQRLVKALGLPSSDYHRFMAFLRHHKLKP